jgi:hypothetical protein
VTPRGLVFRALVALGLVCAVIVALASSILLHGAVLVFVLLAVVGAACMGYVTQDGGRAAALEVAWMAAAATAATIVLVTGLVVLTGGVAAAVLIGLAAVTCGLMWLLMIWRPRRAGGRSPAAARGGGSAVPRAPAWQPPVSLLPTSDLGTEWLRTTWALAGQVAPGERQDIIRRRQETLDELERRDPDGFARWLAAGPVAGSDPAAFVRGDRTTDRDVA